MEDRRGMERGDEREMPVDDSKDRTGFYRLLYTFSAGLASFLGHDRCSSALQSSKHVSRRRLGRLRLQLRRVPATRHPDSIQCKYYYFVSYRISLTKFNIWKRDKNSPTRTGMASVGGQNTPMEPHLQFE